MAAPKKLRAVTDEDARPKAEPMSIADAAENGTARDELIALRARIAKALDAADTRPADLASLSLRLTAIRKELEALDATAKQEATKREDATDGAYDASAI
jgi:hypothetical protein